MKRQVDFSPPKEPQKILAYIYKYKKQFIITALSGIAFNTFIVFGPIFQGKLLDSAIEAKEAKEIFISGIKFILVTIGFQVARFFKRYYVRDMANRISGDMRIGIISSLLNTDLNTLEKQKVGDMMVKTIGDVDIVVEAIRKTITELWDTWVLMIAYFVTLMIYDVKITLIASIPIPLAIIAAQLMKKVVHAKSKESRKANSKTTLQIRKMISQVNILRLYGREDAELQRLQKRLEVQAKQTAMASVLKTGLAPIYSSLSTIGILIVIALGGKKVIEGKFTIGTFTAYISIFTALAARTTTAAKVFNIQQGAKSSWERVKPLLGVINNRNIVPLSDKNIMKNKFYLEVANSSIESNEEISVECISVDGLSFKYRDEDRMAVRNISFEARKGMIIGITGAVGSGKSALSLALTGLYNYEGNVYVNDRELRSIPYKDKLSIFSYSGHNPFLFSHTLEHNITWGHFSKEKLEKVLKDTCLNKDIDLFDNGLSTQVGERGIKVSGGQKQRISLARALYKNTKILILDDPFSAVDISTEANIMKNLRQEAKNKIIFICSHRLDNFKYTDKVLVLDKGCIVEEGTHEELISKEGIYSKIIDSQRWMEGD